MARLRRAAAGNRRQTVALGLAAAVLTTLLLTQRPMKPTNSAKLPANRARPRVAVLTAATRRRVASADAEYGELKAAYVYGPSVDNKQRYCVLRGCDLIVGHELPEASGRSARWTKVAWLRRALAMDYAWVVWMDLDCLFADFGDVLEVLDPAYDGHFTPDTGDEKRVNTGFFALKNGPWAKKFVEDVWRHNDGGEGLSDQNSFNHALRELGDLERASRVKEYPKALLNAFPRLEGAYVATEDYEAPQGDGDESFESRVIHFAGQFGGARNSDGVTPPTMLVQFLDYLLKRHAATLTAFERELGGDLGAHARLRSPASARGVLHRAAKALEPCLGALRTYAPDPERLSPVSFLKVYAPAEGGPACDAAAALAALKRPLAALLRDAPPGPPGRTPAYPASLLCAAPDVGDGRTADVFDARDLPDRAARLPRKQVHAVFRGPSGDAFTVVAHECAALEHGDAVLDAASTVRFASGAQRRPPAAPGAPPGKVTALAVLSPPPRRKAVSEDAYVWATLAPLALRCLSDSPRGARLALAGAADAYAGHGAWARLGVDVLDVADVRVEPDELFTCHGEAAADGLEHAGRVRDALAGGGAAAPGGVVVLCGDRCAPLRALGAVVANVVSLAPGGVGDEAAAAALAAAAAVVVARDDASDAALAALRVGAGALLVDVYDKPPPAGAASLGKRLSFGLGLRYAAVDADVGAVAARAAKESEIPNFKGSFLGRFPLVLADFWTGDHLLERSRSVDVFRNARAQNTHVEATFNHPFAAQVAAALRRDADDAAFGAWADRDRVGAFLDGLGLRGAGAEIGTAYGDYAKQILDGWRGCERLTLIDSYAGRYADREATARRAVADDARSGRAVFLKRPAGDAAASFADESLAFLYVDGDKDAVLADLRAFYGKVRPGGLVAGHDWNQGRVRAAVEAFVATLAATPRVHATGDQTPRLDVRGVAVAPCCPTWYFRKRGDG